MCGCEFNIAAAGSAVAGTVLGHFSSSSDTSAIYHSALVSAHKTLVKSYFHCKMNFAAFNPIFDGVWHRCRTLHLRSITLS